MPLRKIITIPKLILQNLIYIYNITIIRYHKNNLVYTVVFPEFLIFQKNNSAET